MQAITLALSKGRILEETLPLLAKIGVQLTEDPNKSRKLRIEAQDVALSVFIVRPSDVPAYVGHGAADLGITGSDVLMEHQAQDVYAPLDLKIAPCRLMVAGFIHENFDERQAHRHLRVATKYVQSTKRYYATLGQQVDIIKLYGSMELAPLVGLADRIVDLVDTGNTLKANGLEPKAHIADISARLLVNKAALKLKAQAVRYWLEAFAAAVA
jgi:ATP phosphoribosyltransferase